MQPTRRRTVRSTPPSRVDQAAALLSRLVSDSRDWDANTAAHHLGVRLTDERLLRQLRARVVRAMLRLPLPSDARALATLDLTLAHHGTSRAAAWQARAPRGVVCPRTPHWSSRGTRPVSRART